jgi:predicted enzyme related to lactoylglutathione lyase
MEAELNSERIGENGGDIMAGIVWFEIPADDVGRAKTFYGSLFGWKMDKLPAPMEYWHADTGGSDGSPDGGIMKRQSPQQTTTSYIGVESVDEYAAKVEALGGKIIVPKKAVPQMGYFAVCMDTENNAFGLWQTDANAK